MPDVGTAAAIGLGALLALATSAVTAPGLEAQSPDANEVVPLVTDRPDFTESAATVAPGRFQLEAGYTFSRSGEAHLHELGEALLRAGVANRVELRLGVPTLTLAEEGTGDVDGFGDASIGFKIGLPEPGTSGVPTTAILLDSTLPTGEDHLGSSGLQPGATLAFAWELAGGLGLGANFGYERFEEEGEDLGRGTGSVALGIPLSPSLGAFLEGFVLVPEGDRTAEPFLDGGLTWLLDADLQLDVRAGFGLEEPAPNYFLGGGISVRW